MATHRLYYDDSFLQNFTARIVSCTPVSPFPTDSGTVPAWEVLLDQTAFYPSSGGQPNDLGKLGEARVLDVRDDGNDIAHIVDHELSPGAADGCVDWVRRFDHMQQHTGQHLLSAMFQERFGLPTVSFHLGGEVCTIDLRGPEPSPDVLRGAQRAANSVVFEDRPVNVRYGTADQLARRGVRKEVDRKGILRAIEIEAADLQPCGGTHVRSTGQIGLILVRRSTRIRQDWRVEFCCGRRADHAASRDFEQLRAIADRLTCSPEQALAAIEKSAAERDIAFKNFRAAIDRLAEARAKLLIAATPSGSDGLRCVSLLMQDESPELLLPLATELAKTENTVAVLVHESTGQLVFSQSMAAAADLSAILKQVLATVPGKGGGTRDFVRAKLNDAGQSSSALALAREILTAG
jgi:alanyl-tRNA synthetase